MGEDIWFEDAPGKPEGLSDAWQLHWSQHCLSADKCEDQIFQAKFNAICSALWTWGWSDALRHTIVKPFVSAHLISMMQVNKIFTRSVSLKPCSWQRMHGMLLVQRRWELLGTHRNPTSSHYTSRRYPKVASKWVQWPQCWNHSCCLGHSRGICDNGHDFTTSRRCSKISSQGSVHWRKMVTSIRCCDGSKDGLHCRSWKHQETLAAPLKSSCICICTSPPCVYDALQRSWKRSNVVH